MNVQEEIKNAVPCHYSHPDAGKMITESSCSTLGEIRKPVLLGRKQEILLNLTGWISINVGFRYPLSVMQFDYDGKRVNIPIRQGTRSQKILIGPDGGGCCRHGGDSCQGIEAQTKKLFEVETPWHSVFTLLTVTS